MAMFAAASFSNQISLGAVLVSAALGLVGLVTVAFGVRYREANKVLDAEHDAQRDRGDRLEREVQECRNDLSILQTEFDRYREQKHEERASLLGELATLRVELEAEKAKHDYTVVLKEIRAMQEELAGRTPLFQQMIDTLSDMSEAATKRDHTLRLMQTDQRLLTEAMAELAARVK